MWSDLLRELNGKGSRGGRGLSEFPLLARMSVGAPEIALAGAFFPTSLFSSRKSYLCSNQSQARHVSSSSFPKSGPIFKAFSQAPLYWEAS